MSAKSKTLSFNIQYAALQGVYWLTFCACVAFAAVYMQHRGYTNSVIGVTLALGNIIGVILSAVGSYGPLAEFAGCGATVPLLGFGHLLAQGVVKAVDEIGLPGVFTGGIGAAAGGITASLVFALMAALVGKSKDQN